MTPNQLVGQFAIRTTPTRGSDGQLDYSYSSVSPLTNAPGPYVKRCLLIERVEPTRIVAQRVSLVSGERREQILDGAHWLDNAWARVAPDGRVLT
jgi:hypothetical protein